ncbi:MAG: phospholipase D-like domain-containing protein [Pyrinomonadaceae bacterium]
MMLFDGQGKVEFSSANYSPHAFTPEVPYSNYTDEVIYFTDDVSVVNSFRTKYDELWTNTSAYGNYANIAAGTTLLRRYATFAINSELNFPPGTSFADRAISAYRAEQQQIDVIMYRITDERHTNEMIAAVGRGVPVRLIHEPDESYRNTAYSWDSYNVDRMYMAGVQIKMRKHLGQTHEKLMLLRSQGMAVHASSNWSVSSANSQQEHNYFTKKGWFYQWYVNHFERKWNSAAEFEVFVPLPPDRPVLMSPANGGIGSECGEWSAAEVGGGYWAHKYDIYVGTDPAVLTLVAADVTWLGRQAGPNYVEDYVVGGLAGGVKYYWKVVGKTMADQQKESFVGSFTTAGPYPPPPSPAPLTVIAGSSSQVNLSWTNVAGEDGYVVERSVTSATSGWTVLSTLGIDITGHQDQNGVAGGRKYYYRVRAYNASGYSPYSAVAQVTTPLTQPTGGDVVLYAAEAGVRVGRWNVVTDSGAAGGARLANPNASAAKLSAPPG